MPFPSSSSSLSSSSPRCHLWFYLKSKILKSDVGQEDNVKQDDTGLHKYKKKTLVQVGKLHRFASLKDVAAVVALFVVTRVFILSKMRQWLGCR